MTRNWKRRIAALASCLVISGCALSFAQEGTDQPADPAAPQKNADEQKDSVEFDENAPEGEDGEAITQALDKAVEHELGGAVKENSPEELLNLATELKLSAESLLDLTKVISLCNKAEKLGLDDDNLQFARQLRLSAQLDRGLAVAQLFMNPDLDREQLPRGWQGLRDNAINDLTDVLADFEDVPVAQVSLGRLYMLADKEDKAKEAFDKAIAMAEDAPDDADVIALACSFRAFLEKDAASALPFVQKAIELKPEARYYSQSSAYYQLLSRTDEALRQIDKAIELEPESMSYKKEKALLLVKARRRDEARALFDEAVKNADDNLSLQIEKGEFFTAIREYDAALDVYTKLAQKYDGPGIYFLRAVVYAQMKDYDKALADVQQALKRDANLFPALRLHGIILLQTEKYDDAVRAFERLKKKAKDEEGKIEATTQIAYALSKKGLYKRASGMLKEILEKSPDNTDVLRSLADMELLFGHWSEADKLYAKLLELSPKDSGVLNNYSWLLATCPDESVRDGKRALEYGKQAAEETLYAMPHILSTLASAYAELGDFESARSWSEKAVKLGEEEDHESLESLKKELESYKNNQPWREGDDVLAEVDEDAPAAPAADADQKNGEEKSGEENAPAAE